MPRNGSGTYTAPVNSWNPATDNSIIDPTDWNSQLADYVSAFTDSLSRTGQGGMSATLDMGSNAITNATAINKVILTTPATAATLTIGNNKTLTVNNSLALTGTDGSSAAFGTGGTVAYQGGTLAQFASTTSAQLAGVIATTTGAGGLVFASAPTLVNAVLTNPTATTPTLGVAAATSINKVTLTTPATAATLTISNNQTLTCTTSTSVGQGQYLGTNTNDAATAGNIGESMSQTVLLASAVSLTTGNAANIATITLTAGDWEIWALGAFDGNASTTVNALRTSISTTSATENTAAPNFAAIFANGGTPFANFDITVSVLPIRVSLSGSQQYWMVSRGQFATSTLTGYGSIHARRMR